MRFIKDGGLCALIGALSIALLEILSWSGGAYADTLVQGRLSTQEWTREGSPYRVTGNLEIPEGAVLTIAEGVEVLFAPGVSMLVSGQLIVAGTEAEPVTWTASAPDRRWGGVVFRGARARGNMEFLEMTRASKAVIGATEYPAALNGEGAAKLKFAHCWLHDFSAGVIDVKGGCELLITGSLIENSLESVHTQNSYAHIEGTHLRDITGHSDLIDFDYESNPRSVVRNCILENSVNDDGIDLQGSSALIENCVLRGMKEGKAISIDLVCKPLLRGLVVSDCLWGLVVKDKATATFENCTVTRCDVAIKCYEKNPGAGGGHATAQNMILWGNRTSTEIDSLSSLRLTYSICEGGYPGEGNIDADPLFADPDAGDFRLRPASPAIGSGKDGKNMGALPPLSPPEATFIRGDANRDSAGDIADVVAILLWLFAADRDNLCADAFDADDSGAIDISDAIYLLGYLFLGDPPPPPPFPEPGLDPTPEDPYSCSPAP